MARKSQDADVARCYVKYLRHLIARLVRIACCREVGDCLCDRLRGTCKQNIAQLLVQLWQVCALFRKTTGVAKRGSEFDRRPVAIFRPLCHDSGQHLIEGRRKRWPERRHRLLFMRFIECSEREWIATRKWAMTGYCLITENAKSVDI